MTYTPMDVLDPAIPARSLAVRPDRVEPGAVRRLDTVARIAADRAVPVVAAAWRSLVDGIRADGRLIDAPDDETVTAVVVADGINAALLDANETRQLVARIAGALVEFDEDADDTVAYLGTLHDGLHTAMRCAVDGPAAAAIERDIAELRADLPRTDTKAQVVAVGIVAGTGAALPAIARLVSPIADAAAFTAGGAALVALTAAGMVLWPGRPPRHDEPEPVTDLERRHRDHANVQRLLHRKWTSIRVAYGAVAVAILAAAVAAATSL